MMRKVYLSLIELLFAVLLVFPYLWPEDSGWSVFPALTVLAIFFAIYLSLLARWGDKAKLYFLVFLLPALLEVGMLSGFDFVSVGIAGAFVFWRGNSLEGGREEDHDLRVASFWSLALIPAMIVSYLKNETFFQISIILVTLQFVVILLGRFSLNLYKSPGNQEEKIGFIAFLAKIIGLLILAASCIALALNYFRGAFFLAVKGILWFYSLIVTPILILSEKIINILFETENRPKNIKLRNWHLLAESTDNESAYYFTGIFLMVLTVLAFFGLFAYLYFKENRVVLEAGTGNAINQSLIPHQGWRLLKRSKASPPGNPLRREVFNFEYFAFKNGFGRFEYETVGEWLYRIGIPSNPKLIGIYEDVRYGNLSIPKTELEFAQAELKGMRELIKIKGKERKKKPKQHG